MFFILRRVSSRSKTAVGMSSVLCLLTVVLSVLHVGWTREPFSQSFPSLDEVRGNGSMLVNTTDYNETNLVFYPNMRFTCSGNITRLRFLALPDPYRRTDGDGDLYIGLHPPQDHGTDGYRNVSGLNPVGGSGTGYEISFNFGEVQFQEGHTLAVEQERVSRLRLLYQVGEEVEECQIVMNQGQGHGPCKSVYHRRPLVTVETDHPECVTGFMSEAAFDHVMAATELTSHDGELAVRGIRFNCSSPRITKWTVGAQIPEHPPQILIYDDGNTSLKRYPFMLSSLNTTPHINVYEQNVDVYLPSSGYIAVNSSQIYYQRCALGGCVDRPLVAVRARCTSCDEECTSGFIGRKELREKARYIPNFAQVSNQTLSFPHMNITQDGYIVKWTFTATRRVWHHSFATNLKMEFPQLIIYDSSTGDMEHCINSSQANTTEYPNVYEMTVYPPIRVSVRDYIAVHQPHHNMTPMLLSFVKVPTPTRQEITIDSSFQLQPMIHLEIVTNFPSTSSPTTAILNLCPSVSPTPSFTPLHSVTLTSTGLIHGLISGIVIPIVVVAIVAVLVVVIAALYVKRKRLRSKQIGTINPTYDSGGGGVVSGEPQAIYAEPVGDYRDHSLTTSPPPSMIDNEYSTLTDPYSLPQVSGTKHFIDAVSNAEYFHHTQLQNHYEFAIYVPTKEQREQLASDGHIYATLEEAQVGAERGKMRFFEEEPVYWDPASDRDELYAQLASRKYREIPPHQIQQKESLGSGQFGMVSRGVWQCGSTCVEVAVKSLQDDTTEEDAVRFLQEAAIMGQFRHPNIVQLLGVVTMGEPVMIVTELAHNGDLREYLLNKLSPDPGELPLSDTAGLLSQFCLQVAEGMDYLSSKSFVHRDLAARNILITDDKKCKISDFGMSRDLVDDSYYVSSGGQIPIKWTAPEALHMNKYSTASDVWSFGCLMYEIWSLGHKPFEGFTNIEAVRLIDEGHRLAPPPGCPKEVYQLMINCWNGDKSARPQFNEVVQTLSQSEHELLHIPEEVTRGHPQASVLGAPLEAGRSLYTELQNTYMP